jgi:hypothetical protein
MSCDAGREEEGAADEQVGRAIRRRARRVIMSVEKMDG